MSRKDSIEGLFDLTKFIPALFFGWLLLFHTGIGGKVVPFACGMVARTSVACLNYMAHSSNADVSGPANDQLNAIVAGAAPREEPMPYAGGLELQDGSRE